MSEKISLDSSDEENSLHTNIVMDVMPDKCISARFLQRI